jgi:hypothetical protein
MKTMTCKQLFGPCEALIHGETAEKMMENSKKHAMEMVSKGDQDHIKVMEAMKKKMMTNPESSKKMMEEFQENFVSQPEDK